MDAIVLGSRNGQRLELHPVARPHEVGRGVLPTWRADLIGNGLSASIVCPEAGWEPQSLADYFRLIDEEWRGWVGERRWQSEETELRLTARHNGGNAVLLAVVIEEGAPPRWRCEAELELDPGAFRAVADAAVRLGRTSVDLG